MPRKAAGPEPQGRGSDAPAPVTRSSRFSRPRTSGSAQAPTGTRPFSVTTPDTGCSVTVESRTSPVVGTVTASARTNVMGAASLISAGDRGDNAGIRLSPLPAICPARLPARRPSSTAIGASRLHRQVCRLGRRLGNRLRGRDVGYIGRGGRQRGMPEELLDDGQGGSALDLAHGPSVPEAMRMDTLLDPGLGREPLAERPDVGVPQGLALERAEERVPTSQPQALPAVEPAVDSLGRVARQRRGSRLVALPMQHADGTTGGVEVFGIDRERLGDAQPGAEEDGE